MELIDIIKSSVILFIFSLLMVLIISYTLYKIRNQARMKNLGYNDHSSGKIIGKDTIPGTESLILNKQGKFNNDSKTAKKDRFVVVNEEKRANHINTIQFAYQANIYKFYEELNSKIMFKIKPGINSE